MKVINVIISKSGILKSIKSFVIEEHEIESEKVALAEEEFSKELQLEYKDNPLSSDELNCAIEIGAFSNNNGFQALLVWSEIM